MANENLLSDEELEELEKPVTEDRLDRLELLRRALNNSRVEQMYHIKRSSNLKENCPYYKKAVRLFEKDEKERLLQQIRDIVGEF